MLGRLGSIYDRSCRRAKNTHKNLRKIDDFCLPGARPGRPVGRLGGRPGLLRALLGRLEAILGRLEALLVRLGALWCLLGASWCSLGPCLEAAKAARTKKIGGRFSEDGCVQVGGSALITL